VDLPFGSPRLSEAATRAAQAQERLHLGQTTGALRDIDAFVDSWQRHHPVGGGPPAGRMYPAAGLDSDMPLVEQSLSGESMLLHIKQQQELAQQLRDEKPLKSSHELRSQQAGWDEDPFMALAAQEPSMMQHRGAPGSSKQLLSAARGVGLNAGPRIVPSTPTILEGVLESEEQPSLGLTDSAVPMSVHSNFQHDRANVDASSAFRVHLVDENKAHGNGEFKHSVDPKPSPPPSARKWQLNDEHKEEALAALAKSPLSRDAKLEADERSQSK